jgi:hypothetical protein
MNGLDRAGVSVEFPRGGVGVGVLSLAFHTYGKSLHVQYLFLKVADLPSPT